VFATGGAFRNTCFGVRKGLFKKRIGTVGRVSRPSSGVQQHFDTSCNYDHDDDNNGSDDFQSIRLLHNADSSNYLSYSSSASVRHLLHAFFSRPNLELHSYGFDTFTFQFSDMQRRVGLYYIRVCNSDRWKIFGASAEEPTPVCSIRSDHEDIFSLCWAGPLKSDSITDVQESVATLTDIKLAEVLRRFLTKQRDLKKIQRGMVAPALLFFTIEGTPYLYLPSEVHGEYWIPSKHHFRFSVVGEFKQTKTLFRKTLQIDDWKTVKEVPDESK
jgi:hypothetical protein